MKKVLILTYYWPPGAGPGVQRWLKFCKFLPEFGWEPIVITVKNGSYPSLDPSLEKEIDADLKVFRTKTLEPFAIYNSLRGKKGKSVEVGMGNIKGQDTLLARMANYIRANHFIPDARVGWNAFAYPEALKAIHNFAPDVIITTGPPHSTHLVGERIHQTHKLPWIADLRDPWTSIYYNKYLNRTPASEQKDKALEDKVAGNATALMLASPGLEAEFKGRAKQLVFIPNGYDEDDFQHLHQAKATKFKLAYVGNLKAAQNITALWKALANFAADQQLSDQFELEITGNVSDEILQAIIHHKIEHLVKIKDFVPHAEAVQRMHDAHLLLLPIPMSGGNESILTGKLFEYLASRRPILGIGPVNGNAAAILHECDKEAMLDYEDEAGIASRIGRIMDEYRIHPAPLVTGNNAYKNYSRRGSTAQLARLLNSVAQ